ncbi:histidine phosphatase family protein [Nocardioides rubriscoriae]|uniref:histidine phosphatase family protein n=1 Tax=Nocardioides rubriscoriae TaxID=642762 RepID=UPI0014795817|nr:histidine phosphatase family protein [Nocardioides rubriscoriae]
MSDGVRTLVLLRHGRTPWNHEGRIQGHQDVGLDDEGQAQARRTAPAIAALEPTLIWSSDLERTRQTVAPIVEACRVEADFDPRLREFGFGPYEGLSHADLEARDPASHAALRRGDYESVTHAEDTAAVRDRMVAVLSDLLSALEPGQTGLAVSHGAALRLATGALLGWPEHQFRTLQGLHNCGWVVLRQHAHDGLLRLEAYNRTA